MQGGKESADKTKKASFISGLNRDDQDLQLVRDQVLNILIAGRDNTAATLSYALSVSFVLFGVNADPLLSHLLLRNPNALETLRLEIDNVLGQQMEITRAHIQKMSFLHNVLQGSE